MSDLPPASSSTDPTPPRGIPLAEPIASIPPSLTPQPPTKLTQNPQIMAALITGTISLVVAIVGIVPSLISKEDPAPSSPPPVAIVIAFTAVNTQVILPTDTQAPAPTATTEQVGQPNIVPVGASTTPLPQLGSSPVPTDIPPASSSTASTVSVSAEEPNVRLYFDRDSFTIRNQGGGRKTLAGVTFSSDEGYWEGEGWGSLYDDLSNRDCLRVRDVAAGNRIPPAECEDLISVMYVGPSAMFWRDDNGFRVERSGVELGVCTQSPCDLYLPQD